MLVTDTPPDVDSIIRLYGYDLGLSDYPIWDETKREWLNQRIIDHFRYRQIGQETPDAFIFYLNRTMREIMPTVNPIFVELSSVVGADGLYSYVQVSSGTNTTENVSKNTGGETVKTLVSDTPQTQLSEYEDYATNLTEAESTRDTQTADTANGMTENTTKGKQGTSATVVAEWLNGINNALNVVFTLLEPCFYQMW